MVFGFLKKVYGKAVVAIGQPLTRATLKVLGKEQVKPLMTSEQWLKTKPAKVLAPAFAVATIAAALPVVIKKVIPAVYKKLGVGTLILLPSAYQLLKESPTAQEAATGILTGKPGKAVGEIIEKAPPSVKDVAVDLGVAGLIGAGIVGAAVVIAPKVKELLPEKEAPAPDKQLVPETMPTMEDTPVTPETITITTGKKPYKRRRATKPQAVIQYVNLRINNRATGIRIKNVI